MCVSAGPLEQTGTPRRGALAVVTCRSEQGRQGVRDI